MVKHIGTSLYIAKFHLKIFVPHKIDACSHIVYGPRFFRTITISLNLTTEKWRIHTIFAPRRMNHDCILIQ